MHDNARDKIETIHGNALAQLTSEKPPTEREEVIREAYLRGMVQGIGRALRAFDRGLDDMDADVATAYRQLSQEQQRVNEVCTVERGETNGFQ